MKEKKTTTITSETHEVVIVRRGVRSRTGWCQHCAADVEIVKPEEAAAVANVSTRTIYRWIEQERIHHQEDSEENVFVCLKQFSNGGYQLIGPAGVNHHD